MSIDPWHDVKNEVQNSLEAATNLRASFLRIQSTASANSEELNWARNELKGTLAALDADLEDLEESVRIVEEAGGRLFGVEETEVMARRKYVVHVRNQIETMRKEVNASAPPKSPSATQMRHSPSVDAEPHEDDQAEWSRLEQQFEVQRQESTLDTISGTLHTLATQASLIGQEVGEHNELLGELEANVDRSGLKLDSAMKKMKHFIRETEETKSVALLSILINYSRATIKRPEFTHRFFALLAALTMGTLFAYSGSTKSALSTWFLSESLLLVVALVFSFLSLVPILVFAYARSYVGSRSPLSGLLLFPVLWTISWSLVVHISPVGRLGTWTPMTGIEPYFWVLPIFGQPGLDYITGLWAVVLAEYTGQWLMGAEARRLAPDGASPNIDYLASINDEAEAVEIDHQVDHNSRRRSNPTHLVLGLLLLGIIPSYFAPILPPPVHSNNATVLKVSCVYPAVKTPGTQPSLKDYLHETRTQTSRAKIVLWPEGAVHFRSDEEKKIAFENVSEIANKEKAWIGVGYEQTFQDKNVYNGLQRVRGHNALAIFGPNVQPVVYVKQKLVPLVETFSYEHSVVPPPRYPMNLEVPISNKKKEVRTIPLSTAICLDFSAPLATSVPVNNTELGRPALILAPARTWHPDIGKTMFQYASMRATEQGASILWCDGGEGGVSGIGGLAAQGLGLTGGIGQIGTGESWLQAVGIPFPYDAQDFTPTWYAQWGDMTAIILGLALLGVGPAAPAAVMVGRLASWAYGRLKPTRRIENGQRDEATPLLVDA
ncbi:unnamed protein product [Rhizoctonia solani]|uniref:t-SNARE coiled-coil homology domain-containing protein n=1 Tax=Rhizoctonia solani TaxID=456999 RepID=A0A8H3DFH5_9AGAM|nr:unnamed protein product [Rhizoctonia solani]